MQNVLFYTSKILRPIFASPYFFALLVALLSLFALPAADWKRRAVKAAGILVLLALAVCSTPAFARAFVKSWETAAGDSRVLASTGDYDAIVVLGGSVDTMTSAGEHIMLNDTAERLTESADLYRAGIAKRVIVSGGSGYLDQSVKEAPLMAALLVSLGVPGEAIIEEAESRNTYENALLTKAKMEEAGLRRIVLVTSAWHMKRAAAIFRRADIEFTPYAVDTLSAHYGIPGDYLPDAAALDAATRIFRERVGYFAYKLLGRL